MLHAYRAQRWDECERLCHEQVQALPEMAEFCGLYLQRIAEFRAKPPASDWDGVYTATSK